MRDVAHLEQEGSFPRLYAAASLKLLRSLRSRLRLQALSAALCRGLIEAVAEEAVYREVDLCFPRLYAAASLKRATESLTLPGQILCFPRLYAAASLKHEVAQDGPRFVDGLSAALCRGLIEAKKRAGMMSPCSCRFPRLYAAASLKRRRGPPGSPRDRQLSAALCRGLIEAGRRPAAPGSPGPRFPRLYAAASLKPPPRAAALATTLRFPRLYAAASLKHVGARAWDSHCRWLSAALCRGLIEANPSKRSRHPGFIAFRGFMPRPH